MSQTVTVPKTKYRSLAEKAKAYENLVGAIFRGGFFASPPTKNRKETIKAFRATGKYNKKFLESLERGMKQSSYFK